MPAPNHPLPHTETLANGLRISLHHAPHLKRCAAALRVAAGSHDAPQAWPGLAHFLEHLLFLGTERFPAEQGLMAYVQRHGGQVNARTSERTTDYFFELPPTAFVGGLERLCDMLAHPRMTPDDQRREREVLHAEFIAWSRDAAAQRRFALFDGLSPVHPLRAFQAGNRYSLAVPQPAFQQALRGFHQAFYQSGQMTLSLAGPQPLDELRALAKGFSSDLAAGHPVTQNPPPALMASTAHGYQRTDSRYLNLLFACEPLPDGSREAVDFLCTWLTSGKPGGLVAELKARQLIENLHPSPLYQFAGQLLLHIEFTLTARGAEQPDAIREVFFDWLGFFSAQSDWSGLREEYALLQQRKRQVSTALELARQGNEPLQPGLSDDAVATLKNLLEQLQPSAVDKLGIAWQLPPANGFLRSADVPARAGLIRGQTSAHRGLRTFAQDRSRSRRDLSAMAFNQTWPSTCGEAAVYLRWRLDTMPHEDFQQKLERSLHSVREDACQAGVELSFSAVGNEWLLKMTGLHEPMPAILEQTLKSLSKPDPEFWREDSPTLPPQPLMPIRQLLECLPEAGHDPLQHQEHPPANADDLQNLWSSARWDGLAIGLPANAQATLGHALNRMPGHPDSNASRPLSIDAQHLWHPIGMDASEQALLLFCPTPSTSIDDEAAWRLLGHLSQMPFYQRLRVELQLGYAVFSTVRQIDGRTGLLFGVQSPDASSKEILEHILSFLRQLPDLIGKTDDSSLLNLRQTLATQFDAATLPVAQAAELLWQGKLADHPSDYPQRLQRAIENQDRQSLLEAARRLNRAEGGWRCLASGSCPGEPWQVVD